MEKKRQRLEVTVKETIDFIYELAMANPDGVEIAAHSLGYTPSKVVSLLVERKTLERRTVSHAGGQKCVYKWIATMGPTKVFYGSITQELRDRMREKNKKYKAKAEKKEKARQAAMAKNAAPAEPVAPATPAPVEAQDDGELAAVITAAIAAMIDSSEYKNEFVGGFRVVSFKRSTQSAWNKK